MSHYFSIDQLPNRTIHHLGQDYLFFSGTAYLGLPQHSGLQALMAGSIERYGTVFGSSRNGNLRLGIYEKAEAQLASRVGAESALTLSSGMMAGQVVINWLRGQGVTFLYAPKAHPALWHEPAVALPAQSFPDWVKQLPEQLRELPAGPVAIVTNSIDAVWSEYYDFDWLRTLPTDRSITVLVDDSHGLGVLNRGRGIWPQLQLDASPAGGSIRMLVTASLAKAMGMPGGIVLGTAELIADIRKTAFFGACSPMPPAYLETYLHAEALYAEGWEQLWQNTQLAENLLLRTGLFKQAKDYPVFFTEEDGLYAHLLKANILIYSFAYPTASDRANTRIVISAFHTPEDIEKLASAVYDYCF